MSAYLEGRYTSAVAELVAWLEASPSPLPAAERPLAQQAALALSRVGALAGSGSEEAAAAQQGLERLRALEPGTGKPSATAAPPRRPN